MIEIVDGVAREYVWKDGQWVLAENSPWNEDLEDGGDVSTDQT